MEQGTYLQGKYQLVEKKNLAKNTYDFTIAAKEMAELAEAGQFVHLRVEGFMLRRPISICEIDRSAGTLRIVLRYAAREQNSLPKSMRANL